MNAQEFTDISEFEDFSVRLSLKQVNFSGRSLYNLLDWLFLYRLFLFMFVLYCGRT